MCDVEYSVSLHPSKFEGYQSKAGQSGKVTLFIATIWDTVGEDYERFLEELIWVSIIERVCLERAFQRIRMKNRCEPVCKLLKIADLMAYPGEWPQIRDYWAGKSAEV
jgi:hypothetical protein